MKLERGLSLLLIAFSFGLAHAQDKETGGDWGTVGAGYIYMTTETPTGHWISSNGWYVLPTFNINKQIGVFGDFANFYNKGQNIHAQFFGALHGFSNRTRVAPFVFTGIGNLRDSNAGSIKDSFAWFAGGGFTVRLTRWVAFETMPVEYVMNTANGNVGNNFVARAGLALTIPKR
jgi:hypothetical protein